MRLVKSFLALLLWGAVCFAEDVSTPMDWSKIERTATDATSQIGGEVRSFAENEILRLQAQGLEHIDRLELIAQEMGALGGVLPADFSLDSLSNINLSFLNIDSISSLLGGVDLSGVSLEQLQGIGTLAGIDGLQNLGYLSSLASIDFSSFSLSNISNIDFSNFSLGSFGGLGDFSLDLDSLFTLDSISSITESLGFGGQAKGSLQNLIAVEGQMVQQNSAQTMHHTIQTGIYREYLLLWKQLNFIQSNKVSIRVSSAP